MFQLKIFILIDFRYPVFKVQISAPHLRKTVGGAKRDRTADLLLARQALSQLSYGPIWDIDSSVDNGGP